MDKLAVVLACNLRWAPYYNRYEQLLNGLGIPFDLILWNRENIKEEVSANIIDYRVSDIANNGDVKKIVKFILYANFVKRTIKKNHYGKIVFLGTYAGVPSFIAYYLKQNYKNRYWLDIRDLTYEKYLFFYKLTDLAIKNAYRVVISSRGFSKYLPNYDYGIIHNIDPKMDEFAIQYRKIESNIIRISYIGNISYWDECKKFIDCFKNDTRFILNFYGAGSEKPEAYCKRLGITNVKFHGQFNREKTVEFYNDTDIIYNIYGNNNRNIRTAMSNKLYYAMKFHLPLLVSQDTYMEKICNKYSIGIAFKNIVNFPSILFKWYNAFLARSHGNFERAWEVVKGEDDFESQKFIRFIKDLNCEKNITCK